jgi:aspartate/methionine/tyrosine aminotransferase
MTVETFPKNIKNLNYSLRGELVDNIKYIEKEIQTGKNLPFQEVIHSHLGNPHILGQQPLTWIRQGLSLVTYPELFNLPNISSLYPQDIIERSKYILSRVKGGVGSYCDSQGLQYVRETISRFISRRDETSEPDIENIWLDNGASSLIHTSLSCLIEYPSDGIMIPIPEFPLYTAMITKLGGTPVKYYIEESSEKWKISTQEMQVALDKARNKGINVKSLVIINPGNPNGQVLSLESIKQIIEFAYNNRLVILADEVYQDNIYTVNKKFHSFSKVVKSLKVDQEVFSFHSISKGFFGECGLRSAYMELSNFDQSVKTEIRKIINVNMGNNTLGQIAFSLALEPPTEGSPSYNLFISEKNKILEGLHRKAIIMHEMFNKMKNIQCCSIEGALYAMPLVKFSEKSWKEAEKIGMHVDCFYAMECLKNTGIVIIPGSSFGQKDGTAHFRITLLPPEEKIRGVLEKFHVFNDEFHEKYKD